MQVLAFKNVCFAYRKNNFVIDNLDLQIEKNEIHGLLGHNGAGKTTVLRLIAGLLKPDSGHITPFEDDDPKRNPGEFFSYMPETIGIYEKLNTMQNLRFRGEAEGLSNNEIKSRSSELMEKLGLGKRKNELAGYLSNGLKKRLSLACALIKKPRLLLLDEPTNSLDPASLKVIIDLLKELNKSGITILICSHDLPTVAKLCSCVTIIQEGKSIYNSKISDINSLEKVYLEKTES